MQPPELSNNIMQKPLKLNQNRSPAGKCLLAQGQVGTMEDGKVGRWGEYYYVEATIAVAYFEEVAESVVSPGFCHLLPGRLQFLEHHCLCTQCCIGLLSVAQ